MATRNPQIEQGSGPRELLPEFFSSDNGAAFPVIDASPAFIFAHHRKRWVVRRGKLVPELAKIPLVSGCNRVMLAPDGRIRFADTQAKLQDGQWQVIPYSAAPDGRTYLQVVDTMVNGKIRQAVISQWETAHAGESHTEFDEEGYVDWLESLVAKGVIAQITGHRAGEMLEAARTQLSRAELKLATGQAGSTRRVEALRAEVKALEAAAKGGRGAPVKGRKAAVDLNGGEE